MALTPVVYLVDDDPSVRKSLERLISSVGLKAQAFPSARAFLNARRPPGPACLVLDIRMPEMSGLELQAELQQMDREIPIIFITGHGDIPMSVRAMKQGAVDFLEKPFNDQDLLDAIHNALVQDRQAQKDREALAAIQKRTATLTPREREVFSLVVRGLLNKQIAHELGASEKTIKVHRGRVMAKMAAESLSQLVRMAEKLGEFAGDDGP